MNSQGKSWGDPTQFQQYGQELYRHGEYDKALEMFTRALENNHPDALGLLDNRSATYCTLGQYDRALHDAKQMIQKDRQDERGYLRAAKALLLNKKPDKALDTYTYSLKILPKDHPRRTVVSQLHSKLSAKMSGRMRDPFSSLPLELAMTVMGYLGFKQLVRMTRVSKDWLRFLCSVREFWVRIDFSGARVKVQLSSIQAYLKRSKGMLTHATINNVYFRHLEKTLRLVANCPHLTYLSVAGNVNGDKLYELFKTSKKLRTLITTGNVLMSRVCMAKFLMELPDLERFEAHRSNSAVALTETIWPRTLPNLKSIVLSIQQIDISPRNNAILLPHDVPLDETIFNWEERQHRMNTTVPALEELRLTAVGGRGINVFLDDICHPNLRKLTLSYLKLIGSAKFPPDLEELEISCCHRGENANAGEFQPGLSKLQILSLDNFAWMTPERFRTLLESVDSGLKKLEVKNCFAIKPFDITSLAATSALKGLEALTLHGMYQITDPMIEIFLHNMHDLKYLHIPHTQVTGVTIKTIIHLRKREKKRRAAAAIRAETDLERCPFIEILNVKGCEHVSRDAIDYGRERGLTIIK